MKLGEACLGLALGLFEVNEHLGLGVALGLGLELKLLLALF